MQFVAQQRLLIDGAPDGPGTAVESYSLSPVVPCRLVNVVSSEKVRLLDFIAVLEEALSRNAVRNIMFLQIGDMVAIWADPSHLQCLSEYKPQISLREDLANFVNWSSAYYDQ